ncbi:MAG: recombinase family protein [Cyanobacteria bacterium SBLK]|nr:recombinase family protein [Cyanobacteria bacterium SBLK]
MKIGYCRVSTREQSENSHALEQQQARVEPWVDKIITDVESGRKNDRAGYEELLQLVIEGKCTEIAITRIDRLTRSLPELRKTVDLLQKHGCNLRSLDDAIDFSTAAGKFHLNMLGALAEMESDRLAERVKHGWQHLRDKGVAMGAPWGYRKVDDKFEYDYRPFLCLLSTREERNPYQIAREMVGLYISEKSLRGALRVVNERYGIFKSSHGKGRIKRGVFAFSPVGYQDWLKNPKLRGHDCYLKKKDKKRLPESEWDIRYNTHDAIISPEEWQRIERIMQENSQRKGFGSSKPKYPLSGLVYCEECGGICHSHSGSRGRNQPGRNYYFQCARWSLRQCPQKKMVRMEKAEAAVIDALCDRAEQIAHYATEPETKEKDPRIIELENSLATLNALPYNTAIEASKRGLLAQIENIKQEQKQSRQQNEGNRNLLLAYRDREMWESLDREEKRRAFQILCDRVYVRDGEVVRVNLLV